MKSTIRRGAWPVLLALLLLWSGTAEAGHRMSEDEMTAAFNGITLDGIYYDGTFFTEAYHDDGSIRYWDAVGADAGQWTVEKGQFCTFYDGQQGACFTAIRDGDNCFTFYEKDPKTGEIDEGKWTSRGWNRAHNNTCPEAPEAKL